MKAGKVAADTVERQMLSGLSSKEALLLDTLLRRCAAALESVERPEEEGDE